MNDNTLLRILHFLNWSCIDLILNLWKKNNDSFQNDSFLSYELWWLIFSTFFCRPGPEIIARHWGEDCFQFSTWISPPVISPVISPLINSPGILVRMFYLKGFRLVSKVRGILAYIYCVVLCIDARSHWKFIHVKIHKHSILTWINRR